MSPHDSDASSSMGVVHLKSPHVFAETVQRLQRALHDHGIKVFTTIDQQAEAQAVGLTMPPMVLIIFGSPKGGTPLMIANPESGIDLPLKVLVSESQAGTVDVFFNTAEYIVRRHALPQALMANIAPVERLLAAALNA
jgi:uncharacterized protein (DUF302 family)